MAVLQQVHSGTMEERPSKREILHGKLAENWQRKAWFF